MFESTLYIVVKGRTIAKSLFRPVYCSAFQGDFPFVLPFIYFTSHQNMRTRSQIKIRTTQDDASTLSQHTLQEIIRYIPKNFLYMTPNKHWLRNIRDLHTQLPCLTSLNYMVQSISCYKMGIQYNDYDEQLLHAAIGHSGTLKVAQYHVRQFPKDQKDTIITTITSFTIRYNNKDKNILQWCLNHQNQYLERYTNSTRSTKIKDWLRFAAINGDEKTLYQIITWLTRFNQVYQLTNSTKCLYHRVIRMIFDHLVLHGHKDMVQYFQHKYSISVTVSKQSMTDDVTLMCAIKSGDSKMLQNILVDTTTGTTIIDRNVVVLIVAASTYYKHHSLIELVYNACSQTYRTMLIDYTNMYPFDTSLEPRIESEELKQIRGNETKLWEIFSSISFYFKYLDLLMTC